MTIIRIIVLYIIIIIVTIISNIDINLITIDMQQIGKKRHRPTVYLSIFSPFEHKRPWVQCLSGQFVCKHTHSLSFTLSQSSTYGDISL